MTNRYLGLLLVAALGCGGEPPASPSSPGEHRLAVPGGTIWYKVTGSGGTPLVLLHGGPGFSSFYLKPFEELGDQRMVIRYDQLGSGKSDTITDTAAFNIPHFVAELDSLRSHLGIARWHVLGHSWGTILAFEYYRAHPDHVASIVFGSPVFDIPAYAAHGEELLATLPDSLRRAVREAVHGGRYDSQGYQLAINEFYSRYVWRHPVQADLDSSFATFNEPMYNYMQGPSEFTITGTLKDYNVTSLLSEIRVPVLLTVGEFDEVGPEIVRQHAGLIPGARFEVLAGSGHVTTWDAKDENVRLVRDFLASGDSVERPR